MSSEDNMDGKIKCSQAGLEQKVLKNLLKSGYPFEARIVRRFANLSMDNDWNNLYVTESGGRPLDNLGCLNHGIPVQCGVPYLDPIK